METAGNYRETDQGTSFGNQSLDIGILHIAVDFVGKQDVDTATQELVLVGTFEDLHITVRKPLAVSVVCPDVMTSDKRRLCKNLICFLLSTPFSSPTLFEWEMSPWSLTFAGQGAWHCETLYRA